MILSTCCYVKKNAGMKFDELHLSNARHLNGETVALWEGRAWLPGHVIGDGRCPTRGSDSVIRRCLLNVRFGALCGLKWDISRGPRSAKEATYAAQQIALYSITSSARASTDDGISRPSALAVLRLIASSYFTGACTGRSAGLSPLRMRSMYSVARRTGSSVSGP
jgi:hypothetical protein